MKLATEISWLSRRFQVPLERIKLTEDLGYDAVFTAEGSGSDALTPLAYVAGHTRRIKLGTHVASLSARPPTVLAQAFQTLEAMAGQGRTIVGVGNSRPCWTEGWHGRPWGKPVRRMRDYVDVLRQVFAGDGPHDQTGAEIETSELIWEEVRATLRDPVRMQSSEISIPYAGEGALGIQPWVSLLGSDAPPPPILLAAIGPQMIGVAAEIGDGWFPAGFAPGMMDAYRPLLQAGFDRAGGGKGFDNFDIWGIVDLLVIDDVREGLDLFREYIVEYANSQDFKAKALGFPDLPETLKGLMAEGRRDEALACVPDDYVDQSFLIGPRDRIAARLKPWLDSGLTGLIFRYGPQVHVGSAPRVEDLDVYRAIADAVRGYR